MMQRLVLPAENRFRAVIRSTLGSARLALGVAAGSLALFASACDDSENKPKISAPKERSQAIEGAHTTEPSPAPEASAAVAKEAAEPRKLCAGQMNADGPSLPDMQVATAAAEGEAALSEGEVQGADGGWTWVNFWAAWCVPCKEEIPRLKEWETKLDQKGTKFSLVFVSLDDDKRQLDAFLAEQPKDGLRRTYWLKEGEMREKWLDGVGLPSDPELPAHLLVGPDGKVRCVVNGAVEDSDYPRVVELVSG